MEQKNKRLVGLFIVLAMIVTSLAMPFNTQAATKSITLNRAKATIYAGQTTTLKVTKVKGLTSKAVTWKSSNKKVATVTSKGVVKGVKAGTATITATSKKSSRVKATCKVTVKTVKVETINTARNVAIKKGKSMKLVVNVTPTNATNKELTFKSNDPKTAKVDKNGKITGVRTGGATITVKSKDGAVSYRVFVNVYNNPVLISKVTLNKTKDTMYVGEEYKLKATISPNKPSNKKVYWISSNPDVATVVKFNGTVKALKPGTTTITAYAADNSGKKATCKITVKKKPATIKLSPSSVTLTKDGQTKILAVKVSSKLYEKVTWKSSNPVVATVSSSGKVTAKTNGTTTITATSRANSKVKATCKVTVNIPKKDTLKISKDETTCIFTVDSSMKSYNFVSKGANVTVATSAVDAGWKAYTTEIAKGITKDTIWNLINSDVTKSIGGTYSVSGSTKTIKVGNNTFKFVKSGNDIKVILNGKETTLSILSTKGDTVTAKIANRTVIFTMTDEHFTFSDSIFGEAISFSSDKGIYTVEVNRAALDRLNVKYSIDVEPTHVYNIHK